MAKGKKKTSIHQDEPASLLEGKRRRTADDDEPQASSSQSSPVPNRPPSSSLMDSIFGGASSSSTASKSTDIFLKTVPSRKDDCTKKQHRMYNSCQLTTSTDKSEKTSRARPPPRQTSKIDILRKRKKQSKDPLLFSSLDFPGVFKREERTLPIDEQVNEIADTIRQHGLCVIRHVIDRTMLQNRLLPNVQKMFHQVGRALDRKKISWKNAVVACGGTKQQPEMFRFKEAASRCTGRIDIALVTDSASSVSSKNNENRKNDVFEPFQIQEVVDHCLEHPQIYPIIQKLLGGGEVLGDVDGVQLVYAGLIFNLPMSEDQPWHQDGMPLFPEATNSADIQAMLPPYALNVFIPLESSDGDVEHGPTEFLPGSHRWSATQLEQVNDKTTSTINITDSNGEDKPSTVVSPMLKQGDVLIYDYRVCHRGTSNLVLDVSTDNNDSILGRTRKILYLMYARKWFTDHVNFDYTKNAESLWNS